MRNVTVKSSMWLLVGVSAVAWFGLAQVNGVDLSKVKDFFGLMPKVVSIDLAIVGIFIKWGWKLKIFRGWLVPFPDLNGSWVGHIYSDWKKPGTDEKIPPIPVMLTINQSFFHISCVMSTSEMESFSYSEGFMIDPDRQIKRLAYSYTSNPRTNLTNRSPAHDGTTVFKIVEKPKLKLVGRYWTERLSKGEMILSFHSKELLEELPDDFEEHPVTDDENKR